jgi:anti-sigma-K factor RskA
MGEDGEKKGEVSIRKKLDEMRWMKKGLRRRNLGIFMNLRLAALTPIHQQQQPEISIRHERSERARLARAQSATSEQRQNIHNMSNIHRSHIHTRPSAAAAAAAAC